jgi:hypothetical protein
MKRDEKERLPEIEEIASVACAVQNMSLTRRRVWYWAATGFQVALHILKKAKPFLS